jgi:hypothetical protein
LEPGIARQKDAGAPLKKESGIIRKAWNWKMKWATRLSETFKVLPGSKIRQRKLPEYFIITY